MRFVLTDHRHNFFHWLVVVASRIFYSFLIIPTCLYTIAIGHFLAEDTLRPFIPTVWTRIINFYSAKLPLFYTIKDFVFLKLNSWYKDAPIWWGMAVGIPLVLVGISFLFINFFNLYYSIFNLKYNQTHCRFCKNPIRVRDGIKYPSP